MDITTGTVYLLMRTFFGFGSRDVKVTDAAVAAAAYTPA